MSYDLNGQRGNFSFNWAQSPDVFDISLYGPLGISIAAITGDRFSARVETADGQVRSASSADVLIHETLGLAMPVTAMVDWIRGIPGDGYGRASKQQVNVRGEQAAGFTQSGWQISVLSRNKRANPNRIIISRPGARLLIVVKKWEY